MCNTVSEGREHETCLQVLLFQFEITAKFEEFLPFTSVYFYNVWISIHCFLKICYNPLLSTAFSWSNVSQILQCNVN